MDWPFFVNEMTLRYSYLVDDVMVRKLLRVVRKVRCIFCSHKKEWHMHRNWMPLTVLAQRS